MPPSLKEKAVRGMFWSSVERFSVQGIQFVVLVVMARLLTPADYGLVGMLAIFLAVSQSLVDSGFSQALIRKQDRTETDNSTVFYFNIAVGLLLYALLFVSAPWVAAFYRTPELVPVMRLLCAGVVFNSLAVVQRALLTVRVDFKTQAKASLSAAVSSGEYAWISSMITFEYFRVAANTSVPSALNTNLNSWSTVQTVSGQDRFLAF